MLTGLWHGAAWNFVLWGLLFGILLLIEKWVPAIQKLPNFLRHGYVLLIVCLSFVLFNAESLSQAISDMGGMFGFAGVPLVNAESLYYLRSYAPLFIMGIVGATPIVRDTARKIGEKPYGAMLEFGMMAVLLIVCSAYLVDGSFSPFLYFRF
jgi:alginate O-acetyltransferase complex protein AlgI